MAQGRKTTANRDAQRAPKGALSAPVKHNARGDADTARDATSIYAVAGSSVDADERERRRSALHGVFVAKQAHEAAQRRLEDDRKRYADAVIAARDQGATVAEIAQQAGVSRNAIYLFMDRAQGRKTTA